jgi:hypothetical protein
MLPGPRGTLLFFFEIVQFFLQAPVGQDILEFAPGCLTLFRRVVRIGSGPSGARRIDEFLVTLVLVALGNEVIIEIEVIVVSLHHGAFLKKSSQINQIGIRQGRKPADYIRCAPVFNGLEAERFK